MTSKKLDVFLAGSCVSRDTAEVRSEMWSRSAYVARQSLISSANPAITLPSRTGLTSAFQNSMVEGDFGSSLFPKLRAVGPEVDRLVVDLIDERLGVYPYENGGYLTYSHELNRSGLMKKMTGRGPFIEFGTDKHFELWAQAFEKLVSLLKELELIEKVRVVRALFVNSTSEGTSLARIRGRDAAEWNQLYGRYYDLMEEKGLPFVEIPTDSLFSTNAHKWGPAQYHYVDSAYASIADQIDSF